MWPFRNKLHQTTDEYTLYGSDVVIVKAPVWSKLYEEEGKRVYRIYRNTYGSYIAQYKTDAQVYSGPSDYDTDEKCWWANVTGSGGNRWAVTCSTLEDAVKVAEDHADYGYRLWLAKKNAGVVKMLGKLP